MQSLFRCYSELNWGYFMLFSQQEALDLGIVSALLQARFLTGCLNTVQWLGAFSKIPE